MNRWIFNHIACPRDKEPLVLQGDDLFCKYDHLYPIVDGIPILLGEEAEATHDYINETIQSVENVKHGATLTEFSEPETVEIDTFVQNEVPYTSGNLYFSVQHRLTRYPIPVLRLPEGMGTPFLDIGCNWGRWTAAAAKKGYLPIGIDPSLRAVIAARRISRQLGLEADFVVGDCRFLPFLSETFDTVFCYSVYQHLSKPNARKSIAEAARVLKRGGTSLIQMPNIYGIRQHYNFRRRGSTEGEGFEVRYWKPKEILEVFEKTFGPTELTADCYFGLGIQASDADLLPARYRFVVKTSEAIRRLSLKIPALAKVADSVYLRSTKL